MHDHIGAMADDSSHELGSIGVLDPQVFGASQATSRRVHVDADDVRESRVGLEQCRRQRSQFAADSDHEESLFSHDGQITECRVYEFV